MEYNIWFDISGILVLMVILISFYIENNVPVIQYQYFKRMVWIVLLSVIADLLIGLWGNHLTQVTDVFPIEVSEILHVVYFATKNATPPAFLLYVLSVMNIREKTIKGILILLIPAAIVEALIFFSPVTNLIFYIDSAGAYHRGPALPFAYVIAGAYMVFTLALMITYHKLASAFQSGTFGIFIMMAIITVILQGIFPTFLVEGFGMAIGLLACSLAIQKPEEILDGATGFLNKKVFSDLCRARFKEKSSFAVLVIVLENYDILEKSYGINNIEKLVSEVAVYLKRFQGIRGCRISEDKFCLLENKADVKTLEDAIELIDRRFKNAWKVSEYNVVLESCCCMIHCPQDASDFQELMDLIGAVANLGREENRHLIQLKEIDLEAFFRQCKIEKLVKEAVERNLLEVVYQPIYSPKKNRFSSAEALIRMRDEELGNISPAEFIPIAEKNGAIIKIGKYVMDTVCRFMAEHDLKKYGIEYIEVNVSAVECMQEDMVECLMHHIACHDLEPRQINLEITETAISILPESINEKMERLLKEGVTFSLDDYGTGYSNLSRLAALPIEIVKVDKTIVQAAFESEKMKVILDNTLEMLGGLKRKVLVEGVEKKEQADYLIEKGCDYIQGYYYAKPMSADDFLKLIEKQV